MNGILNIDKPSGMTSHDVVARVRRLAHLKRIGHAGTLDPDATGVLLVCLGSATRLADLLTEQGKEYRAVLSLGRTTTTEDASGEILTDADASGISEEVLQTVLPRFVGVIMQVPPMVSAVHHQGKRLYELAREGVMVERNARPVRIDRLELREFQPGSLPEAVLEVACGKGTYIRTLCADIGAALGVGGHMATLRRMQVGAFRVEDSVPLDQLTPENLTEYVTSSADALTHLPAQDVSDSEREYIRQGRDVGTLLADAPVVRILDSERNLLGLGRADSARLYPFKVFL